MSTVAERVAAGAKWLDGRHPRWLDLVDVKVLDLASCGRCVLGQVFGSYWAGLPAISSAEDLNTQTLKSAALGFTVHYTDCPSPYIEDRAFAELTAAWRDLIATRLMG